VGGTSSLRKPAAATGVSTHEIADYTEGEMAPADHLWLPILPAYLMAWPVRQSLCRLFLFLCNALLHHALPLWDFKAWGFEPF
jgi:hypothetical protein